MAVFLLAFGIYARTLSPTISWRNEGADSGDLVTAAFTGGVPHPPGYPLYTTLAALFIQLPVGSVAYRVNLLSALAAAATAVVLYWSIQLLPSGPATWGYLVSASSALFFAFSILFWSQATIASVYPLHAFFTASLLGSFLAWVSPKNSSDEHGRKFMTWLPAILFGSALAHHPTVLLLIPGAIVMLWNRIHLRTLIMLLGVAFLIALLVYLTLPLRAWRDPPINWGDPRSFGSWLWVITGQIYRDYIFGVPWTDYPARLSSWAKMLFEQFGAIGVALGLWGSVEVLRSSRQVGTALGLTFATYSLFAIGYYSRNSYVYLITAYLIFSLWMSATLFKVVSGLSHHASTPAIRKFAPVAIALGLLLLPLANGVRNLSAMDLSMDTEALDYSRHVFETVPEGSLVIADGDRHIFALWYYRFVERPESRVMVIARGLLSYGWYREGLRRRGSDFAWPDPSEESASAFIQTLVLDNWNRHSIFSTDADPESASLFYFHQVGPLYQITALSQP